MDPGPPPGYLFSQKMQTHFKFENGGVSLQGLLSLCSLLSRYQVSTAGMTIDSFATALREITDSASLQEDMLEGFDRDGLAINTDLSTNANTRYFFLPGLSKGLNRDISQFVGKANRYVVFSRSAPFDELLAALTDHCDESVNATQIFFWIQFLSTKSSQTEISETVEKDITAISHTLLVLTSGDIYASGNMSPLMRTFNLYELALSSRFSFDIAMPRTVRLILNQRILDDFTSITEKLLKVNILSSSASHGLDPSSDCRRRGGGLCASVLRGERNSCPGDRELILRHMENIGGGGEGALDRTQHIISNLLIHWFVTRGVSYTSMRPLVEGTVSAARDVYKIATTEEDVILDQADENEIETNPQLRFRFPSSLARVLVRQGIVRSSQAYEEARYKRNSVELVINIMLLIRRSLGNVSVKEFSSLPVEFIRQCEHVFGPSHSLTLSAQRALASANTNVHSTMDAYETGLRKYVIATDSLSKVNLSNNVNLQFALPPLINQDIMRSVLEIADLKATDTSSDSIHSMTSSQACYLAALDSLSVFGLNNFKDEEEVVFKATIGLARVRHSLGRLTSSSLLYGKSLALLYSKSLQDNPLVEVNVLQTILEYGLVLSDRALKISRQVLAESATGVKSSDKSALINNLVEDANDLLSSGIEELKKRVTCGLVSSLRAETFEQKLKDFKSRMESSSLLRRLHETTVAAMSGLGVKEDSELDPTKTNKETDLLIISNEKEIATTVVIETQQLSQIKVSSEDEQKVNTVSQVKNDDVSQVKDDVKTVSPTPASPVINQTFDDPDFDARIRRLIVKGLISRSAVELHKMMAKSGNVEAIKWLSEIGKTSLF